MSDHSHVPAFSTFLHYFSTFFGFHSGPPRSSFKDMVLELVAEQVQRQLGGNVPSLSGHSLPSAKGMAEAIASPLSLLDAKLGAEAPRVDVSEGGGWGQELSVSRDSVAQAMSFPDTLPPTGERSHPPKDVPWRIKRSRPEVGGNAGC